MNIKQTLLGSRVGDLAMLMRDRVGLVRAALSHPDVVGTVANDQLAGLLVSSICGPGRVFVDVGAHIGSVIAAVRRHDPTIKIIAVEAIPEKAEALRRKFPCDAIHSCAAGAQAHIAEFFIHTSQTAYSSLNRPAGDNGCVREIQVQVMTLDSLIPIDADVDVLKLDIEGGELAALRGATRLLCRTRPVVLFESALPQSVAASEKRDLYQFFHNRDYALIVPNRLAHDDDGLSEAGFLESHLYPRRTTNFFAVPKVRRIEIRDKTREVLGIANDDLRPS
jgi:FkbM family methyltransferase